MVKTTCYSGCSASFVMDFRTFWVTRNQLTLRSLVPQDEPTYHATV